MYIGLWLCGNTRAVVQAIRILTIGSDSLGNQHLNLRDLQTHYNGKFHQLSLHPFPWNNSSPLIFRPLGMKHNPRKRGGTIYSRPTAAATTEQPEASMVMSSGWGYETQPLAMAGVFTQMILVRIFHMRTFFGQQSLPIYTGPLTWKACVCKWNSFLSAKPVNWQFGTDSQISLLFFCDFHGTVTWWFPEKGQTVSESE